MSAILFLQQRQTLIPKNGSITSDGTNNFKRDGKNRLIWIDYAGISNRVNSVLPVNDAKTKIIEINTSTLTTPNF